MSLLRVLEKSRHCGRHDVSRGCEDNGLGKDWKGEVGLMKRMQMAEDDMMEFGEEEGRV